MTDVRERGDARSWVEQISAIDSDGRYRALGRQVADGAASVAFAALSEPLIGWAHEKVGERWAPLLVPALVRRLSGMAQRTCLVELSRARRDGLLTGDDATERFESFLQRLREPEHRRAVLERHPVLARQLVVVTRFWLAHALEFCEHFAQDRPALVERFAGGADPGEVVTVHMGLGDPHRGARTVCVVEFDGGLKCVYKPRSLAPDSHFQELLGWVNERGLDLPAMRLLDRGDHGWAEFVEAAECEPGEPARRLFRRHGALLALLYLVRAGDCHVENVIVSGERPFLVDIETLFQPRVLSLAPDGASAAESEAAAMCEGSVLFSGLLPTGARAQDDAEIAGIGSSARTPRPGSGAPTPEVVGAGTDEMRIAVVPRRAVPVGTPRTGPRPLDHLQDIVAGFTEAYQLFVRHRAELAAGPIAAFANDRVRFIVRDTTHYALLLSTSFHPMFLREPAARDRHFDRLRDELHRRPGVAAFLNAERQALWRNDIPLFTVGVRDGLVYADDGQAVPGVSLRPGFEVVHEVLDRLGPDDLALQTWLIRTAVTSETIRSELTLVRERHPSVPARRPVAPAGLTRAADGIAERLASLAVRAEGEAVWLGCSTGRSGNYTVGQLGSGLYDGLLGIATFLGYHAKVRDCAESAVLAAEATRAAIRQLARAGDGATARVGLHGAGGVIYAFAHLHSLVPQLEVLDHAALLAERVLFEVSADEQFEVMGGAAGAILGLAALHRVWPADVVLDAIAAAADRLVATRTPCEAGAGWTPGALEELGVAAVPLGGFAHGASGIGAALAVATELLGDARYESAMRAAFTYEAHLFDPALGDWRDVRGHVEGIMSSGDVQGQDDVQGQPVAWCHGAPGIGIARHIALGLTEEPLWRSELAFATDVTLNSGFGADHSLCHGDLGNLDFLLLAAGREAMLLDPVHRQARSVVEGAAEHGWRCGLHPGLTAAGMFTGLAGIGYGLLRLHAPEAVPSVLALQPPP
ncbi:type 2 lanthipeptide synthetase LanM family protein [Allokutzneria multivorans]|uniref:Type 2 lanthipeptide synthetase LanM family protein n=1 Tax=Allokutzneria multivorans TaxID=1142134 RepID=A0ABP7SHD3_9PSEU